MAFKALTNRTFGVGLKRNNSVESEIEYSCKEKILFKMVLKIIIFVLHPIQMMKKDQRKKLKMFLKDY